MALGEECEFPESRLVSQQDGDSYASTIVGPQFAIMAAVALLPFLSDFGCVGGTALPLKYLGWTM